MGQKVPSAIKKKVISAWLEAKPRNVIADELGINYGSVSHHRASKKRKHKRYRPLESCCSFVEKQQS